MMKMMQARFPGKCVSCGERFQAGARIRYNTATRKCHCADDAQCQANAHHSVPPPPVQRLDLTPIVQFLRAASERGLRAPKLRVLDLDRATEIRVSLTKRGVVPGSLAVVVGEQFLGCVRPTGETTYRLSEDPLRQQLLLLVAQDPIKAAKEYAAVMGRCCFCDLPLTDAGSVEVGYGPVCAKHWGLPHVPKGTPTLQVVPNAPEDISMVLGDPFEDPDTLPLPLQFGVDSSTGK